MKHKSFGEFVDKKKREGIKQLGIIKKALESGGLEVEDFLESNDKEPYIFCISPTGNGSFDGIRIYKIGETIAFRIQKENKTHPYGSAYPLPVEEMFNDFLSDEDSDQMKAGKEVIKNVVKEVRKFFDKTIEAEKDSRQKEIDKGGGNVLIGSSGTDYSSMIYSRG